uniref:Serpin domain-containing protein n=1 Tax=Timema monikensis TaxID=170555 RepID=A0A7R9E721_9NEOP|nr:unnamed protein product [Timema monikensis]
MSGAQQTVTVNPRAVQETVKGNIDFTLSLYKILAKAKSGNIIVSPMSLEVVLAMAYFGARGETAEQIATGISLPAERNLALDGFRHLLSSFKSTSNITLEIANKVFTQQNYVIKEDFQALAKNSFLSEAQALNFADNVVSAGVINQWVEERTKNKIKDLISPDMLDSLTRLVMVNAVYFKGNWQDQFKPEMTTTEPFYVSAEVKKDVRMMHLKKHFRYSEVDELEAQVLELPYEERQVSMVILLPNDRNGLPNLEAKLTSEKLTEVLSQLHSTEVNVSIPRFKLEDTIDLNSVLQEVTLLYKMGMNNMFEESADFSGITDDAAGLKVSQVVQKAFIEVNEEGSEAAAATEHPPGRRGSGSHAQHCMVPSLSELLGVPSSELRCDKLRIIERETDESKVKGKQRRENSLRGEGKVRFFETRLGNSERSGSLGRVHSRLLCASGVEVKARVEAAMRYDDAVVILSVSRTRDHLCG